eukprot:768440-Hanusia_phi.AAC.6
MDRSSITVPKPPKRNVIRIKIISMGDAGCGKSCLIKRYCEEKVSSPDWLCIPPSLLDLLLTYVTSARLSLLLSTSGGYAHCFPTNPLALSSCPSTSRRSELIMEDLNTSTCGMNSIAMHKGYEEERDGR